MTEYAKRKKAKNKNNYKIAFWNVTDLFGKIRTCF